MQSITRAYDKQSSHFMLNQSFQQTLSQSKCYKLNTTYLLVTFFTKTKNPYELQDNLADPSYTCLYLSL